MKIGTKVTLVQTLSDGRKLHGRILGIKLIQSKYHLSSFSESAFFKTFNGKEYFIGYLNPFTNRMYVEWMSENEFLKYNK